MIKTCDCAGNNIVAMIVFLITALILFVVGYKYGEHYGNVLKNQAFSARFTDS